MPIKRISLWSGPRNISTALMYSFAHRPDTIVVDEPLYAYYLKVSGADHPGKEEVIKSMSSDAEKVINEVILGSCEKPVLFIKNMAHHLLLLPNSFTNKLFNLFLIRDPAEMLPSLVKQIPEPVMRDTGLQMQWELYEKLSSKGKTPLVIDAQSLLQDPATILKKICDTIGIPFYENMLNWTAGSIKEDGVWAKYWYHNVHQSTGFQQYSQKHEKVPVRLLPLLEKCTFYYNNLKRYATG